MTIIALKRKENRKWASQMLPYYPFFKLSGMGGGANNGHQFRELINHNNQEWPYQNLKMRRHRAYRVNSWS